MYKSINLKDSFVTKKANQCCFFAKWLKNPIYCYIWTLSFRKMFLSLQRQIKVDRMFGYKIVCVYNIF